jgi:hypothetical protein
MSNKLLKSAYKYISNNICVIATNAEKRAFLPWKKYQGTLITIEEAEQQFEHPNARSLAIVCGKPSGNLEVIDIDVKYDLSGSLYRDYSQAIQDNDQELFDRLMIVQTVSGGYHLYYRCPTISGNLKLANRETTKEERAIDPNDKIRVLIETRGQGGYVLAPPSEGYRKISGDSIPTITADEREMLLELARCFNMVVEQPAKPGATTAYNAKEFGLSPFEDYNRRADVVSLLAAHGWTIIRDNGDKVQMRRPGKDKGTSGDYLRSRQWFAVFTTSSQFEPNKAYLPYAVFAMLECNGDFKQAARRLLDMGYGERREFYGDKLEKQLYKKKVDGETPEALQDFLVSKHGKSAEQARDMVEKLTKIWGEKVCTFWDISDTGKITINRSKLIEFLHITGGFSLYYYDNQSTIFKIVQCRDGFIEDVSSEHIKKFILAYIRSLPETFDNNVTPDDIQELVLKGSDSFFSNGLMEFVARGSFDFLKDTEKEAFFTFRNGVVRVTVDKIELLSYAELKKVVWKSQVIDFPIAIEKDLDFTLVEYMRFIDCISASDPDRRDYALTLIGYLLHKYKDPTKAFAVILAEETENEKDGGGTGKGIFFKAISKIINTVIIDGKAFKQDKSFAFQRVGLDTKLVVLEDVRKNVDFEGFYPMITEGMTVEKKNKDELFIPYADSPKIGFTTNYNVNAVGNHGKRRQKVFEFAPFFKPGNSPEDFFGHKLFDDWDTDEWNRFYNLLFVSVQAYFEAGIKEVVNSEKIKRKQIRLNYGEEFLEWFDDFILTNLGRPRMLHELHKEFVMANGFTEKDYSNKRMKSAIVFAAENVGLKVRIRQNRQAGGGREVTIYKEGEQPAPEIEQKGISAPEMF